MKITSQIIVFCIVFFCLSIRAQTQDINFLVALEEINNTTSNLTSIQADGVSNFVTTLNKPFPKIDVISPFIYLFDQNQRTLSVYNQRGNLLLDNISCVKFSANKNALITINSEAKAQLYIIDQLTLKPIGSVINDVENVKISDLVFMVYKNQNKSIETFKIIIKSNSYFPIKTAGWKQQNIVSSTFNSNFLITKDTQTITRVINYQGNIIYEGRGNFKNMFLTNNHFITYYGNGKIEAFNPYDKQYILSLAKVFDIKNSISFTTFSWDNEITILNEKGEIFAINSSRISQFAQGDNFMATEYAGLVTIYSNSGLVISSKTYPANTQIIFHGDYLCLKNNSEDLLCHYAPDVNFEYSMINANQANKILGSWSNVGLTNLDTELKELDLYLYSGKKFNFKNIKSIYTSQEADFNERSFITF